jgi:hypothetical protein
MSSPVTAECCLCSQSGILFNPLNLQMKDICIDDIAYSLAGQNRFVGHTRLTVAQHSCHVAEELLRMGEPQSVALQGLMHDAFEAYGGDIAGPVKRLLRLRWYEDAETRGMAVIASVFGFHFPFPAVIKEVDARMLRTEQRDLMARCPRHTDSAKPLPIRITVWSPNRAEQMFLRRFHSLKGI